MYGDIADNYVDLVIRSNNKCVMLLYKVVNYIDFMMKSMHIAAMYMDNGTMYIDKIEKLSTQLICPIP